MKLIAKIKEPELFLEMIYESGKTFYHPIEGNLVEAVYFSSNRTVYFRGEMTHSQLDTLKAQAYPAERIIIDEARGQVEISQLEEDFT